MEQLPVCSCADLIHDSGLQIQEDAAWHVLASAGLAEEGVERIVTSTNGLVAGHLRAEARRVAISFSTIERDTEQGVVAYAHAL